MNEDREKFYASPCQFIREHVFGIETQQKFAELLDCSQPKISRYENGIPISTRMQQLIRDKAKEKGITWDNNWFFEVPHTSIPTKKQLKNSAVVHTSQ